MVKVYTRAGSGWRLEHTYTGPVQWQDVQALGEETRVLIESCDSKGRPFWAQEWPGPHRP